jgi:hypothetical protein
LNPWQALTKEEKREVDSLKERDREVRAHEQAHVSAGGQHVRGGAQFETETGPDGRSYATGGEVSIDASPVPNDPLATIQKAQAIRKAALAPAEPSGQDRQVAAEASQMEAEARAEWTRRKQDEAERAAESIRTGATGSYPAASPFAAYTGSDRSPPPSAAGAMHLSIYV